MIDSPRHSIPYLKIGFFLIIGASCVFSQEKVKKKDEDFYTRTTPSRDGIGKFYMGREISQVMGHLGASWLERPKREQEERTDLLIKGMNLKSTDLIADIGAGSGYFSFRMAPIVSSGKVFAVDISPQMLGIVRSKIKSTGQKNVIPVQSTVKKTMLEKKSIDVALLVDAYHEFSHPREMGISIRDSLKADGRLILIEYRKEDPNVMIKPLHKMTELQSIKEMEAIGFKWEKTLKILPQQHFMIFRKSDQ